MQSSITIPHTKTQKLTQRSLSRFREPSWDCPDSSSTQQWGLAASEPASCKLAAVSVISLYCTVLQQRGHCLDSIILPIKQRIKAHNLFKLSNLHFLTACACSVPGTVSTFMGSSAREHIGTQGCFFDTNGLVYPRETLRRKTCL